MYEFLLVFGLLLWLTVGFIYIRRPAASVAHPVTFYLLVQGLVFVIRPILAYIYDFRGLYVAYQFTPSIAEKSTVLAGADLGFVVFVAVCLKVAPMPLTYADALAVPETRRRVVTGFLIAAAFCLPLALYSLVKAAGGGGNEMALDAASGIRYNVSGNGYLSDASLMVGPICVLFAWLFRFRLLALLPFAGFVLLRLSTGQRGPMIVACASIGLFYLYQSRRKWPTLRVVAMLCIAVAAFSVIGSNREAFRNYFTGQTRSIDTGTLNADRPLESMDYGNMEFFEYLVHVVPGKTGTYDYFLDNLQLLTEPVPRVLWPGKPFGAPIQLYSLFDYGYPIGMTMSLPGEGWAQAGWIGIVIWCALFGAIYGWAYRAFATGRKTWFSTALYFTFVPGAIVVLRDGVLLTIAKSMSFAVAPVLFTWLILRLVVPERAAEGPYLPRPVMR